MIMDELEYGVIKEYTDYDIWYEAITDEIDGFVLRDKNGAILKTFSEDQRQAIFTWDGSGD
jgi:hypothetical protein